jgi:MarR family transcriptional regulator for hemolysin
MPRSIISNNTFLDPPMTAITLSPVARSKPRKTGKPVGTKMPPLYCAAVRSRDENWDQRLGFLMHDVSRLRRTAFDQYMKPLNITRSQWWVLIYLARHDGMIQSDLANLLELGKAALGSLIDRLEASGLVLRGADKSDRRAKRVYLSPAGAQLIKEMQGHSHEMSERILEGLSEEERVNLTELLVRVKRNLVGIVRK